MSTIKQSYREQGFVHLKKYLDPQDVHQILMDAKGIFFNQFRSKRYTDATKTADLGESQFNECMYRLFAEDLETFSNCGKQAQHLISLHRLSLSEKIFHVLKEIGLDTPTISTRPVMFFNHPKLAKQKVFYKVDAHQDWKSMQGSLNSVIVWLPLININKDLGALEIVPGSHKMGLLTDRVEYGFGMVELDNNMQDALQSVEVEVGDILLFSSFLIHQSGENIASGPRWSCHFRYNDLSEATFIERGYPHPYIYKPIDELITPNFPSVDQVLEQFN